MRKIQFLIIVVIVGMIISCELFDGDDSKTEDIYGCKDSTATNYNPDATIDDGNCDYCKAGASFLLISTDGGATWDFNCPQNMNISSVFQIMVIDTNNIWLASKWPYEDRQFHEAILYSSDKGRSWEIKQTIPYYDGGAGLTEIYFADKDNGLSVVDETDGPVFYRTFDGGKNWQVISTPPTEGSNRNHERIDIVDLQTVYFINTNISPWRVYGTAKLGAPWDTTHIKNSILLGFYDKNIGLVATHSSIHRTVDQGKTWQTLPQPFFNDSFWGYGIRFSNNTPRNVWLLDSFNIHFSADTGRTWVSHSNEVHFPSDMYIYGNKAWFLGGGFRYSEDATKGNWTAVDFPNQPYPIQRFSEAIGGVEDKIIVLTGSF